MRTISHAAASSHTDPVVLAGAATVDITPTRSVFLFGYPHVPRFSTGVHDPLECAALYLKAPDGTALFLANDLIFFARDYLSAVRERISDAIGVPVEAILISATHTHSGPVIIDSLSNSADSVVPKADETYLSWLGDRMLDAARAAMQHAEPAEIGLTTTNADGIGTNRHDPEGPRDSRVPILIARSIATNQPLACMMVHAMHPTVLHEDSTLISADFPGFTRRYLRRTALPPSCPILYHLGAAGNQSPRHVTRANTFEEAARLGERLGRMIEQSLASAQFARVSTIAARRMFLALQPRAFPRPAEADAALVKARKHYNRLYAENAPRQSIRTAECDVFGAEKTLLFASAACDGQLARAVAVASPAEIQIVQVGPWRFVAWPGEFFVEYALELAAAAPRDTFLITLANGELQGYIATAEAEQRAYYEATNAVFSSANGSRFVQATLALLEKV